MSDIETNDKMALRGRRTNNFFGILCPAASGGLNICVLSTSIQKNDISWPQQSLTEKVQKFNVIFDDSIQILRIGDFEKLSSFETAILNDGLQPKISAGMIKVHECTFILL